jgi:hypothetical protein
MKIIHHILLFAGISAVFLTCKQSDPPEQKTTNINDAFYGRFGDSIRFSGRSWKVKIYENAKWGPGPNFFSGREEDITIDEKGYLHMKIVNKDGKWMSTEVICDDHTGYGTYIFTIEGDIENIPENIVLGLFTWDDGTFQSDANSEVDIEFSKWGNANDPRTLQYGVQPIHFGTYYPEREHRPTYEIGKIIGVSTHAFTWSQDKIEWKSFAGDTYGQGELLAQWSFDKNNPARVKEENGMRSQPVIIPKPGSQTQCRINFWITPWINPIPSDGKEHEIIIRRFEFIKG